MSYTITEILEIHNTAYKNCLGKPAHESLNHSGF